MGLSGHEMILILRARDEASKVLRNIEGDIKGIDRATQTAARKTISQGAALTTVGVGIASVGIAGLTWLNKAIDTAMEYNRQVALTKTQTDKVRVSMNQLADIGIRVGKTIPVPFEEIQPMLYDIFSSMDVSVKGSEKLLTEFSKAAVAGQVSLQEAGRATIAILNAYHLPAQKVNEVNDFMFQLVRKGVGTYGEFASTIGRSIPSAVRAGQTYQQLGGMLAFLTRNGLSTAMATASAGRALDAISHPATVNKLKHFGDVVADAISDPHDRVKYFGKNWQALSINIKDASGNFLPMTDIMKKLSDALIKLPPPERAAVLYELFKGSGGTIQARRFFDVAIPGIKQFTGLTQDMYNARGAAKQAYDIMLKTPAMQAQLLKNQYHALVIEVGTYLIPVKQQLIAWGLKLIGMWNSLSPAVRKTIVQVAAWAAVALTVIGVVTAVAGVILMLRGAFMLMGTSVTAILGPFGLIVLAIAALAAGFIYAWNHSKTFQDAMKTLGGAIVNAGKAIWSAVQTAFTWIVNTGIPWVRNAWGSLVTFVIGVWNKMKDAWNTFTSWFSVQTHKIFDPVMVWLRGLLQGFQDWYTRHTDQLHRLWEYVTNVWKFLTQNFGKWVLPYLQNLWNNLSTGAHNAWTVISKVIEFAWVLIKTFLNSGFVWLKVAWNILWSTIQATVKVAWSIIYNIVAIAWHVFAGAFSVFLDLITGHWKTAWEDIKRMAVSIWNNLKSIWGTWTREALGLLKDIGLNLLTGLKNGILDGMRAIGSWLWDNIAKPVIDKVRGFFGIGSPSKVFHEIGGHLVQGLINGMLHKNPVSFITKIFGSMPEALGAIVNKGFVAIKDLPAKALNALSGVASKVGGLVGSMFSPAPGTGMGVGTYGKGVSQWSTLVLQVLQMLGQSSSWLGVVLSRMQRESGGNPNAINNWDINAQRGDPSRGLMQTIGSTFNAYAGPFRSRGIYDPLANIYAGLNYALHTYGSLAALSRPGGYALGTLFSKAGYRVVGEHGPELAYFGNGDKVWNRGQPAPAIPGKSVVVHQTIYTNEIDPRAHGAALAWEVANRVA